MTTQQRSLEAEWKRLGVWYEINEELLAAKRDQNVGAKFEAIKRLYGPGGGIKPREEYVAYPVDWLLVFSPIEEDIWCYIRRLCLPFYPQWPIGKYFVDFGDPVRRVGIECDGAAWHNPESDLAREDDIAEEGWQLYRIPGWQCARPEDAQDSAFWLIADLAALHYGRRWIERPSEGESGQ